MAKRGSQDKVKSRVNIKYEVETGGAKELIDLPFVIGVMADLSGQRDPKDGQPKDPSKPDKIANVFKPLESGDRKFDEFTHENFDSRMKGISPRVAVQVPNVLSEDGGNLNVELRFQSMDDFSPAAIARNVAPLKKILDARTQLANLLVFMDGKPDVEAKIAALLQDQTLLSAIASGAANPTPNDGGKSNGK